MNTLISFELAKLLKEKGFDEEVLHFYCKNRTCNYIKKPYKYSFEVNANQERLVNGEIDNFGYGLTWSAPTIAEVVMWLYKKYKLWISIDTLGAEDIYPRWFYKIVDLSNPNSNIDWELNQLTISYEELIKNSFNSPTEAYEVAIDYTLNNLIK